MHVKAILEQLPLGTPTSDVVDFFQKRLDIAFEDPAMRQEFAPNAIFAGVKLSIRGLSYRYKFQSAFVRPARYVLAEEDFQPLGFYEDFDLYVRPQIGIPSDPDFRPEEYRTPRAKASRPLGFFLGKEVVRRAKLLQLGPE